MAEVILTPLLQVIFEKLANPLLQKFADYWELDDRFKKLQNILPMAQAIIQDAEERQTTDKAVRLWLAELKDAAWKAEDLLEEFLYVQNSKCSKQYNVNYTKSKNILDDLQKAVVQGLSLPLEENSVVGRQFDVRETSSFVIGSEVCGREEEKKKILEKLLMPSGASAGDNTSVISIVGSPGIGKSTLAQMVYNDDEVKRTFDLRIWVFVSKDFKAKRIMKAAIEAVKGKKCELTELDALQTKLWNALHKKKYLLVLDDVWNQDPEEWDKLRLLFCSGVDGSRVLVTTRLQKVAMLIGSSNSAYHLKGLCEEDSWALFKKRSFLNQEEEKNHQSLLAVGKEIARKCQGIPLVAKVVGGLMRFKREEKDWLHVQNSNLWDLGVYKSAIYPALILSYLHLPPHLKHCFAFCSIFPRDYEIQREKLIHMWMAQGFILPDSGSKKMEDFGEDCFNELLWMSVFEEVNECESGSPLLYKMNSIFYSLAKSITKNEYLILEKGLAGGNLKEVRHASIMSDLRLSLCPDSLNQAKHLRTLLLFSEGGLPTVPKHIFSSFIYLKMLNLSGCLTNLPESIGELSFLRCLDLSNSHFHKLPSSISDLFLLETLNLFGCYNLKYLPPMGRITGLRHLNISRCEALIEMPDGINFLVHLQTLPIYIVPIHKKTMRKYRHEFQDTPILRNVYPTASILELKCLNLRGELKIKHLERVQDVEEAKALNFKDKEYLHSLGLCWGKTGADFIMNPTMEANAARFQERKPPTPLSSSDPESSYEYPTVSDEGLADEVLESLHPHKNLKKLFIVGYPGIKFAKWNLPNLTELTLINCGGCLHLPLLGHLPLLRSLCMEGMNGIIYIGEEIYGKDAEVSFVSLEEIFLRNFPVLQEWMNRARKVSYPKLRKLVLDDCPNLISVPYFASLEHLELRHCNSQVLKCLENLTSLSTLSIAKFGELVCLPDKLIRNNHLLKSVRIISCPKLHSLTSDFGFLTSLTFLSIRWCENLSLLSEELASLTALEFLEITDCHSVKALPANVMGSLRSLQELSIENCSSLESVSFGYQPLTSLKHLTIMFCPSLAALPSNFDNLSALSSLTIISCPLIESLPEGIKNVKTLGSLEIRSCPRLEELPEWLESLASSLRTIAISDCCNLKSLPVAFRRLIKLQHLSIQGCPDLERRCDRDRGEDWWKIAHIPTRYISSSVGLPQT